MKFSENTLAILKNFALINMDQTNLGGIVLKPGNELSTLAPSKYIIAEATIDEEIPCEFGIYELQKFMANVQSLGGSEAEFTFQDNKVIITDPSGFSLDYHGANPELIVSLQKKIPNFEPDFVVDLEWSTMQKALKIANLNKFDLFAFVGKEDGIYIELFGEGVNNKASFKIAENEDGLAINAIIRVEHFKLLPLDYRVEVILSGIAKFISKDGKLVYHVSLYKRRGN